MKSGRNTVIIIFALAAACLAGCFLPIEDPWQNNNHQNDYPREKEQLWTPGNIHFNGEEYKLTWSPVIGAVQYEITVRFGEEPAGEAIRTGGTTMFFEPDFFAGFEGLVQFHVQAIANPVYGFEDSRAGICWWSCYE